MDHDICTNVLRVTTIRMYLQIATIFCTKIIDIHICFKYLQSLRTTCMAYFRYPSTDIQIGKIKQYGILPTNQMTVTRFPYLQRRSQESKLHEISRTIAMK